MLFVIAVCTHQ